MLANILGWQTGKLYQRPVDSLDKPEINQCIMPCKSYFCLLKGPIFSLYPCVCLCWCTSVCMREPAGVCPHVCQTINELPKITSCFPSPSLASLHTFIFSSLCLPFSFSQTRGRGGSKRMRLLTGGRE
jgi:hypothetical protein